MMNGKPLLFLPQPRIQGHAAAAGVTARTEQVSSNHVWSKPGILKLPIWGKPWDYLFENLKGIITATSDLMAEEASFIYEELLPSDANCKIPKGRSGAHLF